MRMLPDVKPRCTAESEFLRIKVYRGDTEVDMTDKLGEGYKNILSIKDRRVFQGMIIEVLFKRNSIRKLLKPRTLEHCDYMRLIYQYGKGDEYYRRGSYHRHTREGIDHEHCIDYNMGSFLRFMLRLKHELDACNGVVIKNL